MARFLNKSNLSRKDKEQLESLIRKEKDFWVQHKNKFLALHGILGDRGKSFSLFFCGDGSTKDTPGMISPPNDEQIRDVTRVSTILRNKSWNASRFTSEESHNQKEVFLMILAKQDIHAIVAIRVIDEGFDVQDAKPLIY